MSGTALIALGGNLGPVRDTIRQAISLLMQAPENSQVNWSGLYRTRPIGSCAGETYFNAAAKLQTTLAPDELLSLCQQIENQLGRTREIHWGPRTIDLDLIGFDDQIIDSEQLLLPHPACWYRRFVLDPLSEISPNWIHPQRKITIVNLQNRLWNRPLILDISHCEPAFAQGVAEELNAKFSTKDLLIHTGTPKELSEEPTWVLLNQESPAWENQNPVSRLAIDNLPSPAAAASLENIVRSALDAPVRIEEIEVL